MEILHKLEFDFNDIIKSVREYKEPKKDKDLQVLDRMFKDEDL